MSTTTMLMDWWTRVSWYRWMITSRSSPMDGTYVWSSWMIYTDVSLHCALIFLAMESGMTLAIALESTKHFWTLQLKTSNESRIEGKPEFYSSIWSEFSTVESDLGGAQTPLLVEATMSISLYPNARNRMSHWLWILANLKKMMFVQVFFMSSTIL